MSKNIPERLAEFFVEKRVWTVSIIGTLTIMLLFFSVRAEIRTYFNDLMPKGHPYIGVHNEFKESFGGSNMVSIMVKVKEGDIFQLSVLEKIAQISRDLRMVSGVNVYQIISLASTKLREVTAGTYTIDSRPLMWPKIPRNEAELTKLRESALSNAMVYGSYVSRDLKSSLITVDFNERVMDYDKVYREVTALVDKHRGEGVSISVVGEPILQGIVKEYLPETVLVFVGSIGFLGLLLFLFFMRSYRGMVMPIVAAIVSAIWAMGIAKIIGINLDPLGVVIAFLITARVISHSVQSINRFDIAAAEGADSSKAAAKASLGALMKPGLLSVVTDAGGILVVALAPIGLLQKAAYIGAIWVSCIAVTGVVLTPVLLSWVKYPVRFAHRLDIMPMIDKHLSFLGNISTSAKKNYLTILCAVVLILVCGHFGLNINIGDATPGTPLLWPDSEYNKAISEINRKFLGTDRMFVVMRGDEKEILKEPEILQNIARFQRCVERQDEVGGSLSIANIIPNVQGVFNEGNPRYEEIGRDRIANAEFLYTYLKGSAPGDMDRFSDTNYSTAGITIYFRDHRGETIRNAVFRMKQFIKENPLQNGHYELAGGLIGVIAAVNEVIFAGQVESIALALFVVLITASVTYRSGVAGLYFMIPILLSNTITFAYMYLSGIGLNINSLPVAALGIGLGVDYSIYVVDGIREGCLRHNDVKRAIFESLHNAGRGVIFTATPLVVCTSFWYIFSSLRFQAEMAILIAIWMGVSALSALIIMPALTYVMKPRFIVGNLSG